MRGVRRLDGTPTVVDLAPRRARADEDLPAGRLRVRATHVLVDEADRIEPPGDRWLGAGVVGAVVAAGDDVDAGLVGASVLVAGPAPCRACPTCRRGQPHLCLAPTRDGAATRGIGGGRALLEVSAERTTTVPTGVSPQAATLLGGAALVGAAAVRSAARLVPGERVGVVGDLAAVVGGLVAVAAGARDVVACPLVADDEGPLTAAGVTAVGRPDALAGLAADVTDGDGLDLVVVAGAPGRVAAAASGALRPGGTLVAVDVVGSPRPSADAGRTVVDAPFGAADPRRDLPWLVPLLLDGTVDLDGLLAEGAEGLSGVRDAAADTGADVRTVHRIG